MTRSICDRCGIIADRNWLNSDVPPSGWGRIAIGHAVVYGQGPYSVWGKMREKVICPECLEHVEKVLASVGEVA